MLTVDVKGDEEIMDLYRDTIGKVADAVAMPATDPPDPAKEFQCSAVALNALANVLAIELMGFLDLHMPGGAVEASVAVRDLARCMLGAAEEWATEYLASRN